MASGENVPSWITADLFAKVLQDTVKDFKCIQNFRVGQALAPGENYAAVMLKVHIDCLLKNGKVEKYTLMLKVSHDSELYRSEMIKWHMFETESGMYRNIMPAFEQLYRDKGVEIRFGAKAYELPVDNEYILLEDLGRRGFRNVIRQNCLDMEHCRGVLKKMAQWHAASAVWVEQNGAFPHLYQKGIIRKDAGTLLETMLNGNMQHLMETVKQMKNNEVFYPELQKLSDNLMPTIYQVCERNEAKFNVLNHGDCWSNNIMFRYNEQGGLLETYFVDLQLPCYGSPAQDLLYFLLSSSQLELKVNCFDEMIRYYYDNLMENLKLLDYQKDLPLLRDIHQMIIKSSAWGIITVLITMAAVLCDRTDSATVDNFTGDSPESQDFKKLMYSNDRFVKHLSIVLPWLSNRGAFEV